MPDIDKLRADLNTAQLKRRTEATQELDLAHSALRTRDYVDAHRHITQAAGATLLAETFRLTAKQLG